jgi:hypothetical protein
MPTMTAFGSMVSVFNVKFTLANVLQHIHHILAHSFVLFYWNLLLMTALVFSGGLHLRTLELFAVAALSR